MSQQSAENSPARELCVAAIQVVSVTGEMANNLARAEKLVAEAAARGAQLAVCPEFLTPGYAYEAAMWRYAEPPGGMTERWLAQIARRHALYLGAGYLEVEGEDFFNTFALAGPDGAIVGRVRKQSRPAFEGWVCRGSQLPKTLDTALGRIAVGICNDNHTAAFFARMREDQPDLILMPHSAPCARIGASVLSDALAEIGPFYAQAFGIPSVLSNKAAATSFTKLPGVPLWRMKLTFPGLSTITDGDGRVAARASGSEGVLVSTVRLDPAHKRIPEPLENRYWSRRPNAIPSLIGAGFVTLERLADLAYAGQRTQRRAAAQAILEASARDTSSHASPAGVRQLEHRQP